MIFGSGRFISGAGVKVEDSEDSSYSVGYLNQVA
jgi:hypothetical protein